MKNIIPNNWWRNKLIEVLEIKGGKATNKEIKEYFLNNYSDYIFKSIKKTSLDGSINGQLQFYSKSDGGNNYTNKLDLFYKEKKGIWCLKDNYKKELGVGTSENIKFNNNLKKIEFFLVYLFLFIGPLIGFSKISASIDILLYLGIIVFQYIFYLLLIQRIRNINVSKLYALGIYSIFILPIIITLNIPYFFIFSIVTGLISFITAIILSLKNETQLIIKGTKLKDSIIFIISFVLFFILLISSISYIGYKQHAIDTNNQNTRNITYKQKSPEILLENYNIKEDKVFFNYGAGKINIFYSNNYDKSNGLNFKFEYPDLWTTEKGKRPHVVSTIGGKMDIDGNKISMVLLINDNLDNVTNNDLVYNINNNIFEKIEGYKYLESGIVTIEKQPFIWNFYEINGGGDRNGISLEGNFLIYQTIYNNKILTFQFAGVGKNKDSIKNKFYSNIRLFTLIMNSVIFTDKYYIEGENNNKDITFTHNDSNGNIENGIINSIPNGSFLREYEKVPGKDNLYMGIYIENYEIQNLQQYELDFNGNKIPPYQDCFGWVGGQGIIGDYHIFTFQNGVVTSDKLIPLGFRSKYSEDNNLTIPKLRFSYYNTKENNSNFFGGEKIRDKSEKFLIEKTKIINFNDFNGDGLKHEFYLLDHWDQSCGTNNYLIVGLEDNKVIIYGIEGLSSKISYWAGNFIPDSKGEVINGWNCGNHGANTSSYNYYKYNDNGKYYEFIKNVNGKCDDY